MLSVGHWVLYCNCNGSVEDETGGSGTKSGRKISNVRNRSLRRPRLKRKGNIKTDLKKYREMLGCCENYNRLRTS